MSKLYETISNLCDSRGISGYRLCKEIGIQPSILTDLKMGRKSSLSSKNADKIARFFGVSVGYLLGTVELNDESSTSMANGIKIFRATFESRLDALIQILEPNSYRIAYRAPGIVITVDNDASATDAEIDTIVNANRVDPMKTEKAPADHGERSVSDAELKFALWGDCEDVDDDDLADVRRYAAFVRERKKDRK